MNNTDKFVSYCRVSTKQQGDSGLGLEAQEGIINYFFPKIEETFIEVKSGKNIEDRPILKQAMEYCKRNNCILVVAKVDRLTRNCEEGLAIWRELNGNIRFGDIPGIPDKFVLTLYFAFAERERELISLRTREGLAKSSKLKGVASEVGNRIPWTSSQREKAAATRKRQSLENPERNRALALAKELKGEPLKVVASKLNESGFSTLTGIGKWTGSKVWRLLN